MLWSDIHGKVHYVTEGEKHSLETRIYDDVTVRQPGKYADITGGGDFVVDTWLHDKWVPLRHADFFKDVQLKTDHDVEYMRDKFMPLYAELLHDEASGNDIERIDDLPGYYNDTLLRTLQVISIAEYRRCPTCEPVGGRFLLPRFIQGIVHGNWTAVDAIDLLRRGKPGLKILRHRYGKEPRF